MSQISRIDKLLALTGIGRTEAKKLISSGRVAVNGVVTRDSGAKASPEAITLDGSPLFIETEVYLMLHKPAGVVTATEDKRFPTVVSLLPEKYQRRKIGPVGRLDRDVTGLVLLTTDGEMAHRLISPKWKAEKTYRAVCEGRLTDADVAAFAAGMELSDFTAKPAELEILAADDEQSTADATLTEGKFHQVKRMFAAVGHPVTRLMRLSTAGLTLDGLPEGQYRFLTPEERESLYKAVRLEEDHD